MLGVSDEDKKSMDSACKCPECPTKPDDAKKVYCYNDRSDKKPTPVACICPTCDVYKDKNFTGTNYYCIVGRPLTKLMGAAVGKAAGK
jgi:rubredoxin